MTRAALLLAGLAGLSLSAGAIAHSITVIGNKPLARACYRAAESEVPRPDALPVCDRSLAEERLQRHDHIATLVNRGIVKFRLGELDSAMADFDAVLAIEPGQPDTLINKAVVSLAAGGSIDEAIGLIDAGLAGGPGRPWVGYYGRAVAHELAGRDALAYRDYQRARELRPGWRLAEQALSRFTVLAPANGG